MVKREPMPITDDSDLAQFWRRQHPGYSYCGRCGMPWRVVIQHATEYAYEVPEGIEVRGIFPLCQGCWDILGSYESRLPYYISLWEWWARAQEPISSDEKIDIALALKAESLA